MNVYRFRKIENLLGEFQELEKQSIYFASPEELNDPMEGFRDVFWQGDKIVWGNFFKHYLCCLNQTLCLLKLTANSDKWDPNDIPVLQRWDQHPTPEFANLFNDICRRVFEKEGLDDCIFKIANIKRKARYDEVLFYFQFMHFTALTEIQKALVEHGLAPENEQSFPEPPLGLRKLNESKFFELMQETEDGEFLDFSFTVTNELMSDLFLTYKSHYHSKFQDWDSQAPCLSLPLIYKSNYCSRPQNTSEENRQLVTLDFPKVYLKQLVTNLLYPRWYAACFTKDYKNSSVWGHYGDGHKGVCLIFEAESGGERNGLTLNQITGYWGNRERSGENWGPTLHPFDEINYQDKAGEIDFFRSIGWLPRPTLMDSWYSDQNGNLSECAAHMGPDGDEEEWRESYWDNFSHDIIIKTKDWEYEQESRLILYSLLSNLDDKRQRTLTYDFNSLKGIIFGINTSGSDKLEIIEIIERKCQKNNRTDFKFYQAYYSHKNGDIRKREVRPLSRMFGNINSIEP